MIHLQSLHLVNVDLSRNDHTDLPNGLNTMRMLRILTISHNRHLASLDLISGHPFLQILRAERCSIRSLPKNLTKLDDLYLSENQLENLDGIEMIGTKSSNSKNFYFNQNKIRRIPSTIDGVRNLLPNIPDRMLNVQSLTCSSFDHNLIDAKELAQTISAFHQKFNKSIIYSRENRADDGRKKRTNFNKVWW